MNLSNAHKSRNQQKSAKHFTKESKLSTKAIPVTMTKPNVAKKATSTKHKSSAGGSGGSVGATMKILNTLAAHKVKFGQDTVDKKKLGALSKVPGASTVRKALAKLKQDGWIVVTKDTVEITSLGMENADIDHVDIPTTNEEHHNTVKADLKPKEVDLFNEIKDGHIHSKKDVIKALGMQNNSTWRKLVAALANKNILEHSKDDLQLTKEMFPIVPRPGE